MDTPNTPFTPEPEQPKGPKKPKDNPSSKILSTGGLLMAILLSLLFGLAYVVRSLKNVKLTLHLKLLRDDKSQKKY
jgi:hypothetical protein